MNSPRTRFTRRSFLVGSAFTLTSVVAIAAQPRRSEHRLAVQKLEQIIPLRVGPWQFATAAGVIVPSEEGPVDSYDQVLTRVYDANGLPSVMLLIAYGSTQGGTLQLHRPETCYPGQGFKLSSFSDLTLRPDAADSIAARTFTAIRDDRTERLLYWTRIGESFPRNTAEEYLAIINSGLNGVVPDGVLVRISSIGPDVARSDQAIAAFAAALIDKPDTAGQILVGNSMAAAIAKRDAARKK